MHLTLLVLAFLWFAFIAPLKVTLAVVASIVLVTAVVHLVAKSVVGGTSLYDAFKSVGLSLAFLLLGIVCFLSFVKGTGLSSFNEFGVLAVLAFFFASYALGFRFGLRATFGASTLVAAISSITSAALLFGLRWLIA